MTSNFDNSALNMSHTPSVKNAPITVPSVILLIPLLGVTFFVAGIMVTCSYFTLGKQTLKQTLNIFSSSKLKPNAYLLVPPVALLRSALQLAVY